MLVLSRKKGEALLIGDHIELTILEVTNDIVKIGINAPREINVLRKELYDSVASINRTSNQLQISEADLITQFTKMKSSSKQDFI